jgi:hypothetical protein
MPELINRLIQVMTPLLIALSLLLFAAHPARSTPLVWSLNNAVFNDGGQAYGSFIYDADTDTIGNINLTTTAGSSIQFDGPYNDSMFRTRSTNSHLVFWDGYYTPGYTYTEYRELDLLFSQPMTNDGGEIPLALGQQSFDEAFAGLFLTPPASCNFCYSRSFVSGSIVAEQPVFFTGAKATIFASVQETSAAPEPSTLALISVALCAFGLWGRGRRSKKLYA